MSPEETLEIERALGIALPEPYRLALLSHGLEGDWTDHPEFITDATQLISENRHFKMDPEDLSEVRGSGLLGAVKSYLMFGSKDRLLAKRQEWFREWVGGNCFVIGSDLGEERYYIVLTETSPRVYCFELETGRSRPATNSLLEWVAEAKRRQDEAEDEA